MKEKSLAVLITIILAIIGLIIGIITFGVYFAVLSGVNITTYNEFNFYKSQLDINGTNVKETLDFNTDQNYHTLFRNFQSKLTTKNNPEVTNSISINSVKCEAGSPYFKISGSCYREPDFAKESQCPKYTEDNEYGCTFGDYYGFNSGTNYQISSDLTLNPENLFKINENYYIKFIAYGRNSHNSLTVGNNLFITGNAVYTKDYPSNYYTIIYIPYTGDITGYKIIESNSFEYDTNTQEKPSTIIMILLFLGIILAHLLPGALFFCSWYFFGKELKEEDIPSQLSDYPNKRKPWEVAAFFSPPFAGMGPSFFSTMLLDFYQRKIVDLKLKDGFFRKDIMIKINTLTGEMDNIEKEFLDLLKKLNEICPKKHIEKGYFNLNKSGSSFTAGFTLRSKQMEFKKSVDKESKKYLEKNGIFFFIISIMILIFVSFPLMLFGLSFLSMMSLIVVGIISATSSLLIRYKEDFYSEYQKWQAFKNWLKDSSSMRKTGTKGVVFWEEYLVYATALGVSKQVLKELKEEGIINEKTYNFYTGYYVSSVSFTSSGAGGGSFGGAGGGGVGGGGGGGR